HRREARAALGPRDTPAMAEVVKLCFFTQRSYHMLRNWFHGSRSHSRKAKRGRRKAAPPRPYSKLHLELLEHRLAPATHTWIGGVPGNAWSNDGNWMEGMAPMVGEANVVLIFGPTTFLTSTNDITGLTVQTITFSANGYTVNGNAITLTN